MSFGEVAKFGGTSAGQPGLVKEHLDYDSASIVVMSAPGLDQEAGFTKKATDMLRGVESGSEDCSAVQARFAALGESIGMQDNENFRQIIENIPEDIEGCLANGWPVESQGERWMAMIMAQYLGRECVQASEIIRFDRSGNLDLETTENLIQDRFEPGELYVVPGYYGADEDGNIHVFERGGSDITGALIARALDADEYHNWSDVSGFMTADPRYNEDARMLDSLKYKEVQDMAENGCQLLHPEVCRYLGDTAVTTVMRNTFGPVGNRGTEIAAVPQRQYAEAMR